MYSNLWKKTLFDFIFMFLFIGTVELAYGTPYLLSLGLPTALTSLVWLAGPISGILIQPLVGVYSDKCTWSLGRRRPFMLCKYLLFEI
jgi:solute carrier family 45 protein 1/2/4